MPPYATVELSQHETSTTYCGYGNIMGILWEYDGNMMGILWEYYGNINGSHARHSNLAVNCRLASPELGFWRSHAGFRSLGSCQPREHSKYTTRYDQRSGHSLELGDSSGFL